MLLLYHKLFIHRLAHTARFKREYNWYNNNIELWKIKVKKLYIKILNRAQLIQMIQNILNLPVTKEDIERYGDVESKSWFHGPIM